MERGAANSIGKLLEAIRKQGFQVAYLALVNSLLLSAKWPIYTIEMAYFPKLLDALNVAFTDVATKKVDVVHLCGVMGDVADGYSIVRTDDEATAFTLRLGYIFQLLVVHQMPAVHRLNHLRVATQGNVHQGYQRVVTFLIALGLGEYHHVTVITDALAIFQGDRVGYTAI